MKKMDKSIETGLEVAVIGMAGRFPNSKNIEEYFERLAAGEEMIRSLTDEELLLEGISVDLLNDKTYIKSKGIIDHDDLFDSAFFGYTPKDAEIMDPQIRLFHECAWEVLEDAGYNSEHYKGSIGVCACASLNMGWHQYVQENFGVEEAEKPYANRDFLASLVAYKLNLKGPAFMIHTACSSGLVAIHEACRAILMGESKMMLAGGASVSSPQKQGYKYEEGIIMSPDGHLHPFDMDSQGAVGGSGVGVVLLKSLKNAVKDKDHIYAVIKSSAINNDGLQKIGFTAPSVEGQCKVIKKALRLAQVKPEDIFYLETHGTGTKLGDPTEIEALKKAFQTKKRGYCALGAVKANIGHLDVASGIAGFIKIVMILNKKVIPPLINYTAPNEEILFLDSPFYTPLRKQIIKQQEGLLTAGVSSFGIGGTNAHIILQEYQSNKNVNAEKEEQEEMILLSAKRENVLDRYCKEFTSFIAENETLPLRDIAYTLQAGRKSFEYRKMIICNNMKSLQQGLLDDTLPNVYAGSNTSEKEIQLVLESSTEDYELCFSVLMQYDAFQRQYQECETAIKELAISNFTSEIKQFALNYSATKFYESLGIKFSRILASNRTGILAACIASVLSFKEGLELYLLKETYEKKEIKEDAVYRTLSELNWQRSNCKLIINGAIYDGNIDFYRKTITNAIVEKETKLAEMEAHMISICLSEQLIGIKSKEMLHKVLGFLWLEGVNIQWEKCYEGETVYRVSLPTYPFERVRYRRVERKIGAYSNKEIIDYIGRKLLRTEAKLYESSSVKSIRNNKKLYSLANQLCASYICNYFNSNGIKLEAGCQYTMQEIKEKTRVLSQFEKMLNAFVHVLEEEKIFIKKEKQYFVSDKFTGFKESEAVKKLFEKRFPEYIGLVELLTYCCNHYNIALSGEEEALSILYMDGKSVLQEEKYQVKVEYSYCSIYVKVLIEGVVERVKENFNGETVRILEVGSGNGILTKELLPALKNYNIEYYFTDIGQYFIDKARNEFGKKYDFIQYKKFDISKSPKEQGMLEHAFDIVVGLNVVHATKNICISLQNLKKTLKPNGIMGLIESIHNERWYNMIDGLAEGWWYFEDDELRKEPLIDLDKWRTCLESTGFQKVYTYPVSAEKQFITDMGLIIAKNIQADNMDHNFVENLQDDTSADEDLIEYQRNGLSNQYVEPETELEKTLVAVLKELFGLEQIGITDNFFEIGMDSIIAIRISAKLQKLGYKLKIADILKNPTIKELLNYMESVQEVDALEEEKEIFNFIPQKDREIVERMVGEDENIEKVYPLTPMQHNILGQNTLYYKKGQDVFAMNFYLEGKVDLDRFIHAWNLMLKKHTILRTAFVWKKLSEPIQIVYKNLIMEFKCEDLSRHGKEEQENHITQCLMEEKKRGFKSSEAPLTRGYIAKISPKRYKFIWLFQHSLIDGWSMNNIINDLMFCYNKLRINGSVEVDEKPFFHYVKWLKQQDVPKAKVFWKKEFEDFNNGKKLNQKLDTVKQFDMDEVNTIFSQEEKEKITKFSIEQKLTINTIIQTAWAIVMRKLTKESDFILAFETSGRTADVEDLLSMAGLFISVMPYRAKFDHTTTCIQWMKDLMERQLSMKYYEYVTVKDISKWTKIPVSLLQEAIYDKTIVYQNFPNELHELEQDFKLSVEQKSSQLNIHLRLYVVPADDLEVLAYYNKHKYQKEEMEQVLYDFKQAIFKMCENENAKIIDTLNQDV